LFLKDSFVVLILLIVDYFVLNIKTDDNEEDDFIEDDDDDDDEVLNFTPFKTRTAGTVAEPIFKKRPTVTDAGLAPVFNAEGVRDESGNWKPFYFGYNWEEFATLNPYMNVHMSLPSGITYNGNIKSMVEAKISDDGKRLIVKCMWPDLLCDPLAMKEGFRGMDIDKESLQAMSHAAFLALAKHRKMMGFTRGQSIYGTTVVDLAEEVETNFREPVTIQDERGGAVLIIRMRLRRESMEAPEHALVVRTVSRVKSAPKKKVHLNGKHKRYFPTIAYPVIESDDDSTVTA
jgi:hypothetical protein